MSNHFTGNELGKLGNFSKLPSKEAVDELRNSLLKLSSDEFENSNESFDRCEKKKDHQTMLRIILTNKFSHAEKEIMLIRACKTALANDDVELAWITILLLEEF